MKPRMEKMTKPAYTLVAQLVTLMMMLSLYGDRKQISAMIRTGRSICAQYCWNHRDNVQLYLSMKGCDELFRLIKTGVKTVSASLQRHLLLCTLPVSDFHFYHTQLRSRVFAKFHTRKSSVTLMPFLFSAPHIPTSLIPAQSYNHCTSACAPTGGVTGVQRVTPQRQSFSAQAD